MGFTMIGDGDVSRYNAQTGFQCQGCEISAIISDGILIIVAGNRRFHSSKADTLLQGLLSELYQLLFMGNIKRLSLKVKKKPQWGKKEVFQIRLPPVF